MYPAVNAILKGGTRNSLPFGLRSENRPGRTANLRSPPLEIQNPNSLIFSCLLLQLRRAQALPEGVVSLPKMA
jgi:hypothetical protein